ncbi:hypothetical protein G7046_g8524 [Stylonectria norvegica]|nr:hypothetical protein G7046_g8524 [Stylonectria norvegica]
MPYKSRELFQYYSAMGDALNFEPRDEVKYCLRTVTEDPYAFRNTLLVAGLHYAWNFGDLNFFEPTYLFHKIETIRLVNECLDKPDSSKFTICVRQIATLSLAECCLGKVDMHNAESHIEGLMTFMDLQGSQRPERNTASAVEHELADRYLILTYNFVYCLKSRLQDIPVSIDECNAYPYTHPARLKSLVQNWHKEETDGLQRRLKALRWFPYFFSPLPPGTQFQDIDGSSIIRCLQGQTKVKRETRSGLKVLLLAFVESHIASLVLPDTPMVSKSTAEDGCMSSWLGISTAADLYMHGVLFLWNARQPMEDRLHRRVLSNLKWDLEKDQINPGARSTSNLWLWKAFTGAFSIYKHGESSGWGSVHSLQVPFDILLRHWSRATNTVRWEDARARLMETVWPADFWEEEQAKRLWESAVMGDIF